MLKGKIIQIISAVVDVKFDKEVPEINSAVDVELENGKKLVLEVAQDLGDNVVKCIAMGPTDGLSRGMECTSDNKPITVPVGEETLGRIFNVLGDAIDEQGAVKAKKFLPIHRKAPDFSEQSTEKEILETGAEQLEQRRNSARNTANN